MSIPPIVVVAAAITPACQKSLGVPNHVRGTSAAATMMIQKQEARLVPCPRLVIKM